MKKVSIFFFIIFLTLTSGLHAKKSPRPHVFDPPSLEVIFPMRFSFEFTHKKVLYTAENLVQQLKDNGAVSYQNGKGQVQVQVAMYIATAKKKDKILSEPFDIGSGNFPLANHFSTKKITDAINNMFPGGKIVPQANNVAYPLLSSKSDSFPDALFQSLRGRQLGIIIALIPIDRSELKKYRTGVASFLLAVE